MKYGTICYVFLLSLAFGDFTHTDKNSTEERVKRNHHNEFHIHSLQNRRLNDGKYSSVYNKLQPPYAPSHQHRPPPLAPPPPPRHPSRMKPVHVPPYAVKMEPLVQYSQRDPLYHDKEIVYNVTSSSSTADLFDKHSKVDNFADAAGNFIDYSPRYGVPTAPGYGIGGDAASSHFPHHYYKEPEPIIEIIIKESNESLPAQPSPATTQTPHQSTKEPIQVFYVKYKKTPTHTGKEEVVYEEPIPALTPLSTDIVENNAVTEAYYPATTSYQNPSPPSTTYRTIIRPDSEVYHSTGPKVTFGNHEESYSSQHRSSEAQKRDSVIDQSESQLDFKTVAPASFGDRQQIPTTSVLEQRQGQVNEFNRFKSSPPDTPPPVPANPIPPNQIQQPLQFEDGSYEQPPPFSYVAPPLQNNQFPPPPPPQNNPQRIVFPGAYTNNIPFRPQHTFNFSPIEPQFQQSNNEFFQPDLQQQQQLLQRQQQQQQQQQPPQQQHNQLHTLQQQQLTNLQQQNNAFPRVTQAILQPFQFAPNSLPSFNQDTALFSPQFTANVKPPQQLPPNDGRFVRPPTNYPTDEKRPNEPPPPPPISYNPQLFHSQIGFVRNDFPQQPFSNQKFSPLQQLQSQQQFLLGAHQQQQNLERQKQFLLEKAKHQQLLLANQKNTSPRRPQENESTTANYRDVLATNQVRSTPKTSKSLKNESHQTLQPIKDGQIFKSISQSEEHQILNQIDFVSNQQLQDYDVKSATNSAGSSTAAPIVGEKYKTPKQYFTAETRAVYSQSSTDKSPTQFKLENSAANTSQPQQPQIAVTYGAKKQEPKGEKGDDKSKSNAPPQLASLPAEVPDDLREQLLSSGILNNADIQILDYDKVGDIPIENLPPEALENLYGSGSAPIPSIAFANASKSSAVEMKVVRYDPSTSDGQTVPDTYVREDSTEIDPVVLNDSSYNRYLPLKIKGSQFPIPDNPLLKNKKITSVVVLAPVDYDYVQSEAERQGKMVPQVHGVRFVSGESLKTLVRNPTRNNFKNWIDEEKETPANKQSVVLLVTNSTDEESNSSPKEIFMYDVPSGEVNKLEGELSSAFVNVAESNADSEDIDSLSDYANNRTPVSKVTSVPVYGAMSDQLKNKSRKAT